MIRRLASCEAYLADESKSKGETDSVLIPDDENDIADIIRETERNCSHITVSGNRTGVCGGCVPNGGSVVSLERMNRIVGIGADEKGYYVRVQPCVTVKQLSDALLTRHLDGVADLTEGAIAAFRNDHNRYFYPIDPTETEGSIGGNIATNASGPRTLKYGPTRDWVRRIRVVLHDGSAITVERGSHFAVGRHFDVLIDGTHLIFDVPSYDFNLNVKNASGVFSKENMDLIDLFIGSEGIFGIITEADVRLAVWHPLISNIMFFPDDGSALGFISDMKKKIPVEFLEYFDCGSIDLIRKAYADDRGILVPPDHAGSAVFFDLPENDEIFSLYAEIDAMAKDHGGSLKNSWGSSNRNDREMMFRFRHSVPQAIFEYVASLKGRMPGIHKMGTDMSVPDDRSEEMMNYYSEVLKSFGLEYVIFGHMGNNHPHVEIILKDMKDFEKANEAYRMFAVKAIALNGSPSAEHGIGKIKTEYIVLMYGAEGLKEIVALKKNLDPCNIFNRGNIVVIQ